MRTASRTARQGGFTLIEIMVGCAISVVGLLVIFQTLAVWNKHSQSTTAGSDADVAGTLAIFNIDRDLRVGGYGIGTADTTLMGCPVALTDVVTVRAFSFTMAPVLITVGAGGAPDSINVLYGSSSFFTSNERVISSTGTSNFLERRNGFKQGDLAILAGTAASGVPACSLVEITDTSNADGFTIAHTSAATYSSYYAASGAASANAAFNPAVAYPIVSSAMLFNLGPNARLNLWSIAHNRVLQRTDLIHGTPAFDVAEGVINLKAQYGVDTNADGLIDSWTTVPPADWTTVVAIRTAVLVRSGQFERSPDAGASSASAPVTTANPAWAGGAFLMTNVDGTTDTNPGVDPNNWRSYRYRVYERVIPLRNMIWG